MEVIFNKEKQKVPIKCWTKWDSVEEKAKEQIYNVSNLPFAFRHIAIMPDVHAGYGITIGAVLATNKVIIPNAVGVDIGCGMCAVKTPWKVEEVNTDTIKKIMGKIREAIPVGFEHHKIAQDADLMPAFPSSSVSSIDKNKFTIILREYKNALTQLGTLGGGNHFIEIQKDQDNNVWIMIHSGSRNLGYKVARYYNDLAKALNGKWYAYVPKEWDLAFFPLDSEEGHDYMKEMQYCVDFAFANRKLMTERIAKAFEEVINWKKIDLTGMINIAHNYAKMEHHFGQNVMVHRKGATLATKDLIGIVPGSQGTASYIVSGLGNPESFMSCSHGAGRMMSRSKAKATLNLADEQKKLDDKGIVHGIRNESNLDEAAGAYKDIDIVMQEQKDLVEIKVKLEPMGVIKGD